MRASDWSRCNEGHPNYAWLSRGGRLLTRQQLAHLEQLTTRLDFEGCHTALRRLRTVLSTDIGRLCFTASDVPEIAEEVILRVIWDRQREDMLRTATDTRRHSFAFVRRFSLRRVAPLESTSCNVNTVSQPTHGRDALRKAVSFSSKSIVECLPTSAGGDRRLVLKPILKTVEGRVD